MADILIFGMKMPTDEPLRLVLNPNGQLFVDHGVTFTEYETIELPEHGDLIDRRELLSTVMQVITKFPTNNIAAIEHLDFVSALLRGATVVVPAERRDADA